MFMLIAFTVALFFAMNIGASGAAASMSIAYGSGAIKRRKAALLLSAAGIFAGASLGGGEVIKTIGSGLIPSSIITVKLAIIILSSAAVTLFIANVLGIPLSTSEVTVGSVIGVGIAYGTFHVENVVIIVLWWIAIPIFAFFLAFFFGKGLEKWKKRFSTFKSKKYHRILVFFVIVAGFLEAFSAGMNNAANAVGPLVGAGLISVGGGMVLGGFFVGLGAMLLGGKVMETNGKKITDLTLAQGVTVSGTSAMLVMAASIYGIPVPMTQVTTSGILGIGASKKGAEIFQQSIIKKIFTVWVVSPVFSLAVAYLFVEIFLVHDLYTLLIFASVLFAAIVTMVRMKLVKKARKYKQGRI
ncbi:anion permease [Pueribacillus theae]|uniref:Anion permease n=1 Tax=Pueribacillus theae TaxID=2171751 RepID=A0A2U1JWX0_9BACI|nr:inorganic phosphate transporter [Pueribacillus theae]PWA09701.1 anion permease [Pueribacillus theae]